MKTGVQFKEMAKRLLGPNEDCDGFYFCSVTCILLLALSLIRPSIHTKTSLIVCWLGVLDIKGNGQLQCLDQYYEE